MDPYRSRLPVSSGMRPSGIRPPGTLAGLRKSYSSESVGPKAYNGPSRGQLPPLSATGRTSIYQNRNSNASSAAKPNFGALASARKSKGVGLFGMTPQNKGRPSFNPGTAQSAGRRSSIAASRHILETRPLSERSYHVQCFEKLFAFMSENGFCHTLSPKFVQSPSTGEVRKIFEFLFHLLDQKLKVQHIDNDVPTIMKMLGYPFQINKSCLVSCSSPQAKGHLFGMLDWLVDTISYAQFSEPEHLMFHAFDDEFNPASELFKLCIRGNFQNTDDELDALAKKRYGTKKDFEKLSDEQAQLETEVENCDEEIKKIDTMPDVVNDYKQTIASHEEYITTMKTHIESSKGALVVLESELAEKTSQLKALDEKCKALLAQLKEQEFGLEEVEWARDRQRLLEEEIRVESSSVEELKRSIRAVKLELTVKEDAIRKIHSEANSWISGLQDLSAAPHVINHCLSLKQFLEQSDIKAVCRHYLREDAATVTNTQMREKFSDMVHKLNIIVTDLVNSIEGSVKSNYHQQVEEADLAIVDVENKTKAAYEKAEELAAEEEELKKRQQEEGAALSAEYEANQKFLSEIGTKLKHTQKEMTERVAKLKREYDNEAKNVKNYKETEVSKFKELAAKEKREVQAVLDYLAEYENNLMKIKAHMDSNVKSQDAACKKLHGKIVASKNKHKK